MKTAIERYSDKANSFLEEVALEWNKSDDPDAVLRITRNVLHILRDHLTPEESLQMIAQLPLFIKGVYVDGWSLRTKVHRIRRVADLAAALMEREGIRVAAHDLKDEAGARHAARCVLRVLVRHVSYGEMEDIAGQFPKELRSFLQEIIDEKDSVF